MPSSPAFVACNGRKCLPIRLKRAPGCHVHTRASAPPQPLPAPTPGKMGCVRRGLALQRYVTSLPRGREEPALNRPVSRSGSCLRAARGIVVSAGLLRHRDTGWWTSGTAARGRPSPMLIGLGAGKGTRTLDPLLGKNRVTGGFTAAGKLIRRQIQNFGESSVNFRCH